MSRLEMCHTEKKNTRQKTGEITALFKYHIQGDVLNKVV